MRNLILGAIAATLIAWAIFLVPFAVFGFWQKSLESRIAAMAISSFVLYGGVLLSRVFVASREWDGPTNVAVIAAFAATIASTGWWGVIATAIVLAVWALWLPRNYPGTLGVQFVVIFVSLIWFGIH